MISAPIFIELADKSETSQSRSCGVFMCAPRSSAVELLACCEVCVSPHVPNPDGTAFFGSPTKVFKYMGLGRAIVASDLEQIGEVLEHRRTALLTPPGDMRAAACAVAELLDDEALRGRLGRAAVKEAVDRYSWDAHVGRILRALNPEGSG